MIPPPNGSGDFNEISGKKFDYAKEGVLVGNIYIESVLDAIGFGSPTEMGLFTLNKGPEVSLSPEPLWGFIFASSA